MPPKVFRTPADVYMDDGLTLEQMERAILVAALERSHWRQNEAARILGISPRVINYKIGCHEIVPPEPIVWATTKRAQETEDALKDAGLL